MSFKKSFIFLYLFLILIFLSSSFIVLADFDCSDYHEGENERWNCTPTTDPVPTITVDYQENPAKIYEGDKYFLYDYITGEEIGLDLISNISNEKYTFKPNNVLYDGIYHFRITAIDEDENILTSNMILAENIKNMDMWITQPRIRFIPEKQQKIAIEKQLPFNIVMETDYPAVCRLKPGTNLGTDLEAAFNGMYYYFNSDYQDLPSIIHNIKVVPSGSPQERSKIPISNPFNYDNPYDDTYTVLCKQVFESGKDVYSYQKLYIGYDPTPFTFDVSLSPMSGTIIDNADPKITTTMSAPQERLYCEYAFSLNQPPELNYRNYLQNDFGRVGNMIEELTDMTSVVKGDFSFVDNIAEFTPAVNYPYEINMTCYNPAMYNYSRLIPFNINISSDFTISFEKDKGYFFTNEPEIVIRTSNKATCDYSFEGEPFSVITDIENTSHIFTPKEKLEDGEHEMHIRCIAAVRNDRTFTFFTDTKPPGKPNVTIGESYCGEDFKIQIHPLSGEKYVSYNISLYNSTTATEENLVYGPIQTEYISSTDEIKIPLPSLTEEAIYTWKVNAIDKAGLSGPSQPYATRVRNPDSVFCDVVNPEGTINITEVAVGYDVLVGCKDILSGCTDKYNYSIINLSDSCTLNPPLLQAKYTSGKQNINKQGKFCYLVSDKAGNTVSGYGLLTKNIDINILTPRFGIASSKKFSLEVETSKEVTCKHGFLGEQHPMDLNDWYNSLKYTFGENKKTTLHSTYISASLISQFNESSAEEEQPWVIICKDGDFLQAKKFKLGYDTTPPMITINANPNPIVDPGDTTTLLTVNSDDPVVCTYLDENKVPTGFENYDPSKFDKYGLKYSTNLEFWGISDGSIMQKIACKNIAQNKVEKNYEIKIKLTDEIGISVESPQYFRQSSATLNVQTTHIALCSYRLSQDDSFTSMQSTEREHTAQVKLSEGVNTAEIKCTSKSSGLSGTKFANLILDTKDPNLEILSKDKTCSLEKIDFIALFNGTGSPFDYLEYTLSNTQGEIKSGNSTTKKITIYETLIEDEEYTLDVVAYDKAGNDVSKTKTIIGSVFNATICDVVPPTSEITLNQKWGGVDITLTCQDEDSGCEDFFNYQFSPNCQDEYSLEYYKNNPIFLDNTNTFCYQVFDKSGNNKTSSKDIFVPNYCYNGIEDPYENGVDCGGRCVAVCGTCENGQQDPFELGVDCGGVCETIKSCTSDINADANKDNDTLASKKECESNYDCLGLGEKCIAGECVLEKSGDNNSDILKTDGKRNKTLGWILLILGLFMMGGGGYYIYDSETKRNAYLAKQQAYAKQQSQANVPNPQLIAQQKAKRANELKERRERLAKEKEKQSQKYDERKNKRSSKLDIFSDEEVKEKLTAKDKPSELDSIKPAPKTMEKIKEIELPKLSGEKQTDYIDLTNKSKPKTKSKDDVFGKLKNIGKAEPIVTTKPEEKTIPKKESKEKVKEETLTKNKVVTKNKSKDSFAALQQFINTVHNNNVNPSEFQHLEHIKDDVSSKEFIDVFTKEVEADHLDETTLVTILKVLIKENKIDIKTTKEILQELANKNFIPKNNIDVLFAKIN